MLSEILTIIIEQMIYIIRQKSFVTPTRMRMPEYFLFSIVCKYQSCLVGEQLFLLVLLIFMCQFSNNFFTILDIYKLYIFSLRLLKMKGNTNRYGVLKDWAQFAVKTSMFGCRSSYLKYYALIVYTQDQFLIIFYQTDTRDFIYTKTQSTILCR